MTVVGDCRVGVTDWCIRSRHVESGRIGMSTNEPSDQRFNSRQATHDYNNNEDRPKDDGEAVVMMITKKTAAVMTTTDGTTASILFNVKKNYR